MITLLAVLLALSIGWTIGYRTRRYAPPAPGCPGCDETAIAADTAFIAEQRARFDAIVSGLGMDDAA